MALLLGMAIAALGPCAAAQAWTESVLYTFKGGDDGNFPTGGLTFDRAGNLYGTTVLGGGACHNRSKGCGTVFKLDPDGTETVLYAFPGRSQGAFPESGVILDRKGNLYGTTEIIRATGQCCGTIYTVTHRGRHKVLYAFASESDGFYPFASLIMDQAANLYGTTIAGGDDRCSCGTVFELTADGLHVVLHAFKGTRNDGWGPVGRLIADTFGNLYGVTSNGGNRSCGNSGCGTVFRLADRQRTNLHLFQGGDDGQDPAGGLIFDQADNLYGVTGLGGGTGCGGSGCGTVFQISPDGTETILADFNTPGGPFGPYGELVMDTQGDLLGTAAGGDGGCGTVFELIPGGVPQTIYSFTCGSDGSLPAPSLLLGPDGALYGATRQGGLGFGVVFRIEE
jgi:uncharacterized repeat protein (TIGR03803 family)